jgi:hypothetical protein
MPTEPWGKHCARGRWTAQANKRGKQPKQKRAESAKRRTHSNDQRSNHNGKISRQLAAYKLQAVWNFARRPGIAGSKLRPMADIPLNSMWLAARPTLISGKRKKQCTLKAQASSEWLIYSQSAAAL